MLKLLPLSEEVEQEENKPHVSKLSDEASAKTEEGFFFPQATKQLLAMSEGLSPPAANTWRSFQLQPGVRWHFPQAPGVPGSQV